jgi:hypothetical protein
MKFQDLKVGTKYAVIPAWDYSSMEKKNPETVKRSHVANAELVSLDKYSYAVYRADNALDPNFKPASKGERSVGYLVKSSDWAGNGNSEIYWLARPQDVVAVYSTLQTRWADQERIEAENERRAKAERDEQDRKINEIKDRQTRLSESCMQGLKAILGDRVSGVRPEFSNRRSDQGYAPYAHFDVDAITMQILIEKVLEAREAVA